MALKAPQIQHYIDSLRRIDYRSCSCSVSYDETTYSLLDQIFDLLKLIAPININGVRELWFRAERGTIEDFGDYEDWYENDEVGSYEEFEELWKLYFPDDEEWYHFSAVEDQSIGYRAIFIKNKFVIQQDERLERGVEYNIAEFAQWILDSVRECVSMLRAGTYNDWVADHLPLQHRTGTILRKHWWAHYPAERADLISKLTPDDISEFIRDMEKQNEFPNERLPEFTASEFFHCCALGYQANNYAGSELPPREQYLKNADGRDDGLCEIPPDSPQAFQEWYLDRKYHGGHPWEVCRGGNSTHVSLYVVLDSDGYYLSVAGDAWTRYLETVKFYLALKRAGYPIVCHEGRTLASRILGTEKIGIVPEGIIPVYCSSYFPNEHIIDYANLPSEGRAELASHCIWQPVRITELLPEGHETYEL